MLGDLLYDYCWVTVLIWAVIYYADYYLSMVGEDLLKQGANKFINIERGYELTRLFVSDVSKKRLLSPRFVLLLLLTIGSVLFVRFIPESPYWFDSKIHRGLFEFIVGAFLLMEAPLLIQHVQNIFVFRYGVSRQGLLGHLEYARWLSHGMVSVYAFCFVLLFLGCFLVTSSFFLAGGAYGCLVNSIAHFRLMRKHLKEKPITKIDASGAAGQSPFEQVGS